MVGGTKGKRFILRNSRMLLHQPLISGVLEGPATDLSIEAAEIIRLRLRLYEILAKHSGQPLEKVERDCDRNKWLDAEQAVQYGAVDSVLEQMPEAPAPKPDAEKAE